MTNSGVAMARAMTVPVIVRAERARRDPPVVAAVMALTILWERGNSSEVCRDL